MASNEIMQAAIGPWQVIIVLAIVLLLFGGKKIPELMKGLGKGIKEFKDASKGDTPTETPADNNNKIEAKN